MVASVYVSVKGSHIAPIKKEIRIAENRDVEKHIPQLLEPFYKNMPEVSYDWRNERVMYIMITYYYSSGKIMENSCVGSVQINCSTVAGMHGAGN